MIIDGNIDLSAVDQRLADLQTRGERAAPAFKELQKPLRADQRDHSKTQQGPSGSWVPRSPLTEARRAARGRNQRANRNRLHKHAVGKATPKKILGKLPNAMVVTVGELFVKIVSRVDWSGVHQEGGVVGKHAGVPQRTFYWLSDKIVGIAEDIILKHVMKDWPK